MADKNNKIFWLEGFEGKVRGGAYFRSRISKDVEEFEEKFDCNIVGIRLDTDYESGKASWNVEFLTEHKESGPEPFRVKGEDDEQEKSS
tara:strand:+ start:394 stop:660 length:267 start_codon:yes stop_codon:yes gene_type:complete